MSETDIAVDVKDGIPADIRNTVRRLLEYGDWDRMASVTRAKYLRQLAGEILTGEPAPEGYSNVFMDVPGRCPRHPRRTGSMRQGGRQPCRFSQHNT